MQENEIWSYKQMVYLHNQESVLRNETRKLLWNIVTNRSPDLGWTSRHYNNQKNKWACRIVDFDVFADHRVKWKGKEKKDKYLDFTWELIKLWNMKMMKIPIVIDACCSVTVQIMENLEIRGRVETIQAIAFMRRILETWGDWLSFKIQCGAIS